MDFLDFLVKNSVLVLIMVVSGGMLFWGLVFERLAGIREVGPQQATMLHNQRDALLLDLRETNDYSGGRLPKALHLPLSQLSGRVGELAKHQGKPIIVYCNRGNRSRMAGRALKKAGHGEVYSLAGGIEAWKSAGFPLEKA